MVLLRDNPVNTYNSIITIDPSYRNRMFSVRDIFDRAASKIFAYFDDIDNTLQKKWIPPTEYQIRTLLEFTDKFDLEKDNVVFGCFAGISRSSACAYSYMCQKTGDPQSSLSVLDWRHHYPNKLVVELASNVLNLPLMNDAILSWKEKIKWKQQQLPIMGMGDYGEQ